MQSLEKLELDNNRLRSLPKELLELGVLKTVDVRGKKDLNESDTTVALLRKKGVVVLTK